MSSPFNPGRDSNADPSNAFGQFPDGEDSHQGAVDHYAYFNNGDADAADRLNEVDYRPASGKP
jgi:hypothetical protein